MLDIQSQKVTVPLLFESGSDSYNRVKTVGTMSIRQRLKAFLASRELSEGKFEQIVDLSKGYVSNIKGGISSTTLGKIAKQFPELDTEWLLSGAGAMLKDNTEKKQQPNRLGENQEDLYKVTPKASGRDLGELNYPYEYVGENKDNTYINIGNGQYLMLMPLVDEYAYGSYPGGYKDREYIEDLQKHTIVVDKKHQGCYRAFEMIGDSMENYENEEMAKQSIPDGSIVTGRNIQRHHWTSRLHINKWDFIVVHKTEGIAVKRIKEHDVATGNIVLASLNPDKRKHKDFTWHLDDVQEIYSVVNVSQERR